MIKILGDTSMMAIYTAVIIEKILNHKKLPSCKYGGVRKLVQCMFIVLSNCWGNHVWLQANLEFLNAAVLSKHKECGL